MKKVALVLAGGVGSRMGQEIPKQFIEINNKPILIYTLEGFEKSDYIDSILVVCVDGWHKKLKNYAKQFKIDKLKWIVSGGSSGQESIRNGLFFLEDKCLDDDIVVIHDGIRPMVDETVLEDVIETAIKYGNGVSSLPYNEQIFIIDKNNTNSSIQYINRETLRRVSTPQAYNYSTIINAYKEAFEKEVGIHGSHYANTMMVELGHRVYFAKGSDKNIKLTTPEDLELFKGYLKAEESNL